jgi:DNA-binding transcriptional LysR family regulator
MRFTGHPFLQRPTLAHHCQLQHLVVSLEGDPHGFVDTALAKRGRWRRVALTVPNFMFALALIAETDLICALPRRFVASHAARFRVVAREPPLPLTRFAYMPSPPGPR